MTDLATAIDLLFTAFSTGETAEDSLLCAHVWPDELETGTDCLQGCGTAYAKWSEGDESGE